MSTSKIEWTEKTWNPITGCTKVSDGCKNCYAENLANRLKAMGTKKYVNGFQVNMHENALLEPLQWRKPTTVFVCSMSDLFHEKIPYSFIDKIMQTIKLTPQHRYQVLTKRAERMSDYFLTRKVPQNVWTGVTVENAKAKKRIEILKSFDSPLRFLSCEPLLGDLGALDLQGIDWVIVGGESGVKARKIEKVWIQSIMKQCEEQNVSFFFKQWGTWGEDGKKRNKKENGKTIDGKIYQEIPEI